jgi:hypothetical protein
MMAHRMALYRRKSERPRSRLSHYIYWYARTLKASFFGINSTNHRRNIARGKSDPLQPVSAATLLTSATHVCHSRMTNAITRRVEDNMRSEIRTAVRAGNAHQRKRVIEEKKLKEVAHDENKQKEDEKDGVKDKQKGKARDKAIVETTSNPRSSTRKTEFETLSSQKPKRLNDIVDAPPDLSSLTKKNKVLQGGKESEFGKRDIIPPEQKRMMEIEREKAIRRYRELKQKRESERPGAGSTIEAV